MSNKRISELTTSSVPIKSTDYLEVSVYNGSTYDSKKVNSDYLKPYKVYTALLTQSGTSAPTATVLENTIGSIVWSRTSTGYYKATLTGAFTVNKTAVIVGSEDPSYTYGSRRITADEVLLRTYNISTASFADDILYETTFEIRVYN